MCLHELIDDPHVFKQFLLTRKAEKIYLVLEYMAGGELQWKTADDTPLLSTSQTHAIFRDVINGLEYLHHNGIIHRDIKPANLLWTSIDPENRRIKISDFGVSVLLHSSDHDEEMAKTAGSPAFFAPELCGGDDFNILEMFNQSTNDFPSMSPPRPSVTRPPLKIGFQIDIWAVGVTLYCISFGCVPFIAPTELKLFQVICKQRFESLYLNTQATTYQMELATS